MGTGFYEENCMGRKKKEVETSRRIYIPDEHMEQVVVLVVANEKESSRLTRYRLWKFIEEIIPEIKDGQWTLNADSAVRYFIEEQL
jgi:hypothetical protein